MPRKIFLWALLAAGAAGAAWSVYRALYPPDAADAASAGGSGIESALYRVENLFFGVTGGRMQTSDAGLAQLGRIEGFSPVPYPDASGFSIGFGHFIQAGESFDTSITEPEARALLADDVRIAEDAINSLVDVQLTQQQFDSLVSLVYNIGAGAFRHSTLLARLNEGDAAGAAAQFAVWNKSNGGVIPALVNRRQREAALFSFGTYA